MGVIVSRDYSFIECRNCKAQGPKVYGENDGQRDVFDKTRQAGWRISPTDTRDNLCPKCWEDEMARSLNMTTKTPVTVKEGMRVRLCVGMAKVVSPGRDPSEVTARFDYMDWVAGRVPVGTQGVLYQPTPTGIYRPLSIKWDGITPRRDTEFGSGLEAGDPMPYWLEVVSDATEPEKKDGQHQTPT